MDGSSSNHRWRPRWTRPSLPRARFLPPTNRGTFQKVPHTFLASAAPPLIIAHWGSRPGTVNFSLNRFFSPADSVQVAFFFFLVTLAGGLLWATRSLYASFF